MGRTRKAVRGPTSSARFDRCFVFRWTYRSGPAHPLLGRFRAAAVAAHEQLLAEGYREAASRTVHWSRFSRLRICCANRGCVMGCSSSTFGALAARGNVTQNA